MNTKGPFSGKGTPKQIVYATYLAAKKDGVDIARLNKTQLKVFMQKSRIGVDCSGFVFHLANCFQKEIGQGSIVEKLLGKTSFPDWRAAWRVNADMLTSPKHTVEVPLDQVQVGDIIRNRAGKHLLFIIEANNETLTYAHSSKGSTKQDGVHLAKIVIKNWQKGLEYQLWQEQTLDGENYGKICFDPKQGDSIKRIV